MNKPRDLSFKPGPGETPPVLAGRKEEKEEIKLILDRLKNGNSPGQNIVLVGPRGNGKTVLLQWVKEEVDLYKGEVKCAVLDSDCFRTRDDLVGSLARDDLVGSHGNLGGFKVERLKAKPPSIEVEASRHGAKKEILRDVLEQRCSENGLAILIDEAHTLYKHPDEVRKFFFDVQTLACAGRPLLLILAGTPNISRRLAEIEIPFWNRIRKLGIGRLDDAEARDALQIPLQRMGYNIDDKTLNRAASEAQCYPYFLQIVGAKLHRVAEAEPGKLGIGQEIGSEILEHALTEFSDERDNYYNDRYRELRREDMLPVAEAVASRFVLHNERSITGAALEVTIQECIRKHIDGRESTKCGITKIAAELEDKLRESGFVWSRIGEERWCEPGIPSLMNYILDWKVDRDRELDRIRESSPPSSS